MNGKLLSLIPAALLLGACASDNRYYDPADTPGEAGYSEVRLDEDRYRVSYTGDVSMSESVVRELALMRAAELTREEGYDWFRVVAEESQENLEVRRPGEESSVLNPDAGETTIITSDEDGDTVVYQDCGPLGCTTTSTPEYRGGDVVISRSDESLSTTLEIVMGEGEVVDPTVVYNADALYDYLESRYIS